MNIPDPNHWKSAMRSMRAHARLLLLVVHHD